ncbi:hypothetical protein [Hyphobacterium sp.]|uniref:hypothetical protein n=1 Tax=Hyphobacterium sp. TaxID=2004662 RepID=UPI003B51CCE2
MIQFLLFVFDLLAGFAMISLGLAYTRDASDCAIDVQVVSVEYFIVEESGETAASDCASIFEFVPEPAEVFRI